MSIKARQIKHPDSMNYRTLVEFRIAVNDQTGMYGYRLIKEFLCNNNPCKKGF